MKLGVPCYSLLPHYKDSFVVIQHSPLHQIFVMNFVPTARLKALLKPTILNSFIVRILKEPDIFDSDSLFGFNPLAIQVYMM